MKEKLQLRYVMTINGETINERVIKCNKNASIDKMFT